jgi:hypothetical protein
MMQPRVGIGGSSPGFSLCKILPPIFTAASLNHVTAHSLSQRHILFLALGSTTTATGPVVGISFPMAILFATFRIYSRTGREGWSIRYKEVGREGVIVLFDNR